MCVFNIGDRVQVCSALRDDLSYNPELQIGASGIVCHIDSCTPREYDETGFDDIIGVEWDLPFHDRDYCLSCEDHCDERHGWYVFPDEIELITDDDIEIDESDLASNDDLLILFGCK